MIQSIVQAPGSCYAPFANGKKEECSLRHCPPANVFDRLKFHPQKPRRGRLDTVAIEAFAPLPARTAGAVFGGFYKSAWAIRSSGAVSTPQDGASATCAENLFTECVGCWARGNRYSYLIEWSEPAGGYATADHHGFDISKNCGIAAPGSRISGERRRLRKTA